MLYINTRQRAELVKKHLPKWAATGMEIRLVVEAPDVAAYERAIDETGVRAQIVTLEKQDQGLPYSRNSAVEHAAKRGHSTITICDDDYVPAGEARNWQLMEQWLQDNPEQLGIGAWNRIYQNWLDMPPHTGVQPHKGSMGYNVKAYSIDLYLELGGIRTKYWLREDAELVIRAVLAGYGPWWIHTEAHCAGVQARWAKGGNESAEQLSSEDAVNTRALKEATELAAEYPEFVSLTTRKNGQVWPRISWKKLYDGTEAELEF